jgi:pyruvate formate lyase activating enzyme
MHQCRLNEGQTGLCRTRKNENGKSISINYGHITSISLDPIEKKPLARFCPGTKVLSVGSFGCNLDCPFCQNDSISTASIEDVHTQYMKPDELAVLAEQLKPRGNIGIAFTYNEPMVGYEYVRDTAIEIKKRGMKNVVVTNGSVTAAALNEVLPYIDAYNIDLKGFTEDYYKKLGGDLNTVLDFIGTATAHSHVELTTLIVPDENDTPDEMEKLSEWIASVDRTIPLHISRFFPRRKMIDKKPTDILLMHELADIAILNLDTVLLGNI